MVLLNLPELGNTVSCCPLINRTSPYLFLEGSESCPGCFWYMDGPWIVSWFPRPDPVLVFDILEETEGLFNVLLFRLLVLHAPFRGSQEW